MDKHINILTKLLIQEWNKNRSNKWKYISEYNKQDIIKINIYKHLKRK